MRSLQREIESPGFADFEEWLEGLAGSGCAWAAERRALGYDAERCGCGPCSASELLAEYAEARKAGNVSGPAA